MPRINHLGAVIVLMGGFLMLGSGCHHIRAHKQANHCDPPVELNKRILPPHIIEPPDVLQIEAIQLLPGLDYELRPFDVLAVQVVGTPPGAPIEGGYPVEPGGEIDFGPPYGTVRVVGLTLEEAEAAIDEKLRQVLKEPQLSVGLASSAPAQAIAGPHLVTPDGTVRLGAYGAVSVVGLTIDDAKEAIEEFLSKDFLEPEVSVDVLGYNSKVYYLITQGATLGDQVIRLPITGNETVLDAISEIGGLSQLVSKPPRIWIARACPGGVSPDEKLSVNWKAITRRGDTRTNYQILPGDRLYVASDRLEGLSNTMARITRPLEQIGGFALFGTGLVSRFSGNVLQGGGNENTRF